jgi:hypothetical protein
MKLHTAHKRKHKRIAQAYRRHKLSLRKQAQVLASKYECEVERIREDVGDCFIRNTAMVYFTTNYTNKHGRYKCRFEVPMEFIENFPVDNNIYSTWQECCFTRVHSMLASYLISIKMEVPILRQMVRNQLRVQSRR